MLYVYILTDKFNRTIYTGVTNDLIRRVYEHKTHAMPESFTAKYDVTKLVYYEYTESKLGAIEREKQIKGWNRNRKIKLINSYNPAWRDLYDEICK